jgi:arylsulfatase A-like enzyme
MLYEGGTRVVALANWPGHITPGSVVDQPIQNVDMYPTFAKLAGASVAKCKPLDGLDVWATIGEGKPSPREEVIYDIEPFRAAVRRGNWKLVWRTVLPSRVELFDLSKDPSEKVDLSEQNSEKLAELRRLAESQAQGAVPPLLMQEGFGVMREVLMSVVAFPDDAKVIENQP